MLRESVLQLLFAETPEASAAALRISKSYGWGKCACLAHRWGALPRLNQRIAATGSLPPQEVRDEINRLFTDGYVRSVLEAQGGIEVLRQFQSASLRAAGFKGLESMAVLYPDPKQRVILDVDILIEEADLPRAASLLARLGFRPEVQTSLPEYLKFVRHAPGFGGNEGLSFHNDRGNTIDLHWRLGAGFDPHAILSQSVRATLFEKEFPVVAAQDGLLLCVHHSLRNHFSPEKIMRDLMDLEEWCGEVSRTGQLEVTLREAVNKGLAVPLFALARILAGFRPNGAGAAVASQLEPQLSARQRRSAQGLSALFMTQVREGPLERDLLYLFRPSEMRQILAGLLAGGRRHLDISKSMDAAIAGEPVPLSHRLAVIGRSLGRIRPRHVSMLRALARAKDEFAGRT